MSDIQETDMGDVSEKTAFYRENGIIKMQQHDPTFPFKETYDKLFAVIKPLLEQGHDSRVIATSLMCVVLDQITMNMAALMGQGDYNQETDMSSFMEMLMGMVSHMEAGINTNAALASHNKSIYNIDKPEEEKPHLDS